MAEYKTEVSTENLFRGAVWLNHWLTLDKKKKWTEPPRGAAGEALIALQFSAQMLYEQARVMGQTGEWVPPSEIPAGLARLGSDKAMMDKARALPQQYRQVAEVLLCVSGIQRGIYHTSRRGVANASWAGTTTPGGATGETATGIIEKVGDWFGFGPSAEGASQAIAVWVVPVTLVAVTAVIAGAWYGSEVAAAGVAIEAERAYSAAKAWQAVQIAQAQIAAGQAVEIPDWMSRGAAIEAAQSSPWLAGGIGAALGAGAITAIGYAVMKKPRRDNPSKRGQRRKVLGVPVGCSRTKRGYVAWIVRPDGSRGAPIDVSAASSYDQCYGIARREIARLKPGKKKRSASRKAKRKHKKNPTRAATRPATRNPKKKRSKKRSSKRSTARRTTKRTTKRKGGGITARERFLRKQMAKGRSKKQAAADYKGRTRLRKMRKGR